MFYANFDDHITDKLGVIVENWPLDKFCSPSDIGSQTEMTILIQALKSGTTRFRKLTTAELEDWRNQRLQGAMSRGSGDGETTIGAAGGDQGGRDSEENTEPMPPPPPSAHVDNISSQRK